MSKHTRIKESPVRVTNLLIGPGLFLLCILALPHSIFTTEAARGAIGTVAWMAYWWITAPVDFAVTGLLPLAVNALFQFCDMSAVIANYSSETILLLLGASVITAAWENTGLDRRIASWFLLFIGSSLKKQLIFWFLLTTVLSSVLPNAVVCAAITPIAVAMLRYIGISDIGESRPGSMILMTIAYGAGLGGLATPLGGAMNLVTVNYIEQLTGKEYIYSHWVIRFLPIVLVLVVSNLIYLLLWTRNDADLGGSKEYFEREYRKMGKMKSGEKWALGLFLTATVLAFTRQFYQNLLPGLKPAYAFIICAILAFVVTQRDGSRLLTWKSAEHGVIWDMLLIFAGGLAAGTLIGETGAADNIATAISHLPISGGIGTIFVIVTFTLLMSDITSNTATAAVAIPIVITIAKGIGANPLPYVYIASIGVNLSYMLPTSIRAIPVGYGLKPRFMLKTGVGMSVMVIALMTVTSWLLMTFWPAFSAL